VLAIGLYSSLLPMIDELNHPIQYILSLRTEAVNQLRAVSILAFVVHVFVNGLYCSLTPVYDTQLNPPIA
jgi:hypothetical protein